MILRVLDDGRLEKNYLVPSLLAPVCQVHPVDLLLASVIRLALLSLLSGPGLHPSPFEIELRKSSIE